jgi:hypothetical protein
MSTTRPITSTSSPAQFARSYNLTRRSLGVRLWHRRLSLVSPPSVSKECDVIGAFASSKTDFGSCMSWVGMVWGICRGCTASLLRFIFEHQTVQFITHQLVSTSFQVQIQPHTFHHHVRRPHPADRSRSLPFSSRCLVAVTQPIQFR